MPPKACDYELGLHPTHNPLPGTECVWHALKTKSLRLHHMSDRQVGALLVARAHGLLKSSDLSVHESDFNNGYKLQMARQGVHLEEPLRDPNGTSFMEFCIEEKPTGKTFVCSGGLPFDKTVLFNEKRMRSEYGDALYDKWVRELLFRKNADGTVHRCTFAEYPSDLNDFTPPGWPVAASRDSVYCTEAQYRLRGRECLLPVLTYLPTK